MKLEKPQIYDYTEDGAKAVFEEHPKIDEILYIADQERQFLGKVIEVKKERQETPPHFPHRETVISPWKVEIELIGEAEEEGDALKAPTRKVPRKNAEIKQPPKELREKVESYLNRGEEVKLWKYNLCEKAAERLKGELEGENGYPERGTVVPNDEEKGLLGEVISKIQGESLYCQHGDCTYNEPYPLEGEEGEKFTIGEDTPIIYFGGIGISGISTYPHLQAAESFWLMVTCPGCGYQINGSTVLGDLATQAENQGETEKWRNLQAKASR